LNVFFIAVTSPSPGSSTDIQFEYKGPFAEQDDGQKNLSRYYCRYLQNESEISSYAVN